MLTKKNKKKKSSRQLLFSVSIGLVCVGVIAFLVLSNWKIGQKRAELNSQIDSLQSQIQNLQKKNSNLQSSLNQSQSQDYTEQVARNDLGLQKPGEEVVVVKPSATPTAETAQQQKKSFWQELLARIGL